MNTILAQDEITSLLQGDWSLDCLGMRILRSDGHVAFSGAGNIHFVPGGTLHFVLYDRDTEPAFPPPSFQFQAGDVLPPDYFMTLEAVDLSGDIWIAESVDTDTSSGSSQPGCVVRGEIRELKRVTTTSSKAGWVRVHTLYEGPFISNRFTETRVSVAGEDEHLSSTRDVWSVTTTVAELSLRKRGDVLSVWAERDEGGLPSQLPVRLEEAVSFVLGRRLSWIIEEVISDGNVTTLIRSHPRSRAVPRLGPPINVRADSTLLPEAGLLLDRFLTHVVSTPPAPGKYHPLAVTAMAALAGSAASIENESLTLGVEVENTLSGWFEDKGAADPDFVTAVATVVAAMPNIDISSAAQERITGAVQRLTAPHPTTALRRLRDEGVIEHRHVKGWSTLRNRAVHGNRTPADLRKAIDQCNLVYQLLLILLFRIIGYAGRFTDQTKKGWPSRGIPTSSGDSAAGIDFDPTWTGESGGEVT